MNPDKCGCYYCLEICDFTEIGKWVDGRKTPLCPNCGIDSLAAGLVDVDKLRAMRDDRFGSEDRKNQSF
jgi:hypothetical protein